MQNSKVRKPSTRDSRQRQILPGFVVAGNEKSSCPIFLAKLHRLLLANGECEPKEQKVKDLGTKRPGLAGYLKLPLLLILVLLFLPIVQILKRLERINLSAKTQQCFTPT
jgi:hypothetical protein